MTETTEVTFSPPVEQEPQTAVPVGWLYQFKSDRPIFMLEKEDWAEGHALWKETPLYATPTEAPLVEQAPQPPAPETHMEAPHGWVGFNSGPTEWFWSETREDLEHELSDDVRPATHLEKYFFNKQGNHTHEHNIVPPQSERNTYARGVRDGIDQALVIAKEQAGMMADLAIEGLPENARNREAMEAALRRFGDTLRVTLEALSPQERLPYDMRLQIGKALDRLVCDDSTPEQIDTFIQTFTDFGLRIVADDDFGSAAPPQTREVGPAPTEARPVEQPDLSTKEPTHD